MELFIQYIFIVYIFTCTCHATYHIRYTYDISYYFFFPFRIVKSQSSIIMTMSRAGYLFINFFLVRIRIYLLHMLFVCARAHARAKRWRLAVVPKPMCVSLNTRSTILDHEQQQKNRDRKRCMHTLRTHTHTDRWMEFYNEKRSESLVGNSKHLVFFLSRFETFLFSFSKSRTLIWWYCNTCMHDILFTKNQQNIDRKKNEQNITYNHLLVLYT